MNRKILFHSNFSRKDVVCKFNEASSRKIDPVVEKKARQIWQQKMREAKKSGKSATGIFIKAMLLSFIEREQLVAEKVTDWLGKIWLGEEMWSYLKKESEEKGTSMASIWLEGWKEFFNGVPEKIRQTIQEKVIDPIKSMFSWLFKTGEDSGKEVEKGLKEGTKDTEQEGTSAIQNFIRGLNNTGDLPNVLGRIGSTVSNVLSQISNNAWGWGSNIVNSFREGMESARGWLEVTVNSISNLIGRYWESLSPPKEGPLKNIDKWGANLTKTYADSISGGVPYLENAIGDISGGLGSSFAGGAANNLPSSKTTNNTSSNETVINKNYYIQPGQMIASQGEIRNFVRMLKEYNDVEEER